MMSGRTPNGFKGVGFSEAEYQEFRAFLMHACGIDLGEGKEYLVATRVRRILTQEHVGTVTELLRLLRDPVQRALRQEVVDAMTTNETLWFRDSYPFEYLKNEVLPLHSKTRGDIKIWSAACSYGQEPYSISMTVHEFNRTRSASPLRLKVHATDISSQVLASAKAGCYDRLSIARGLSQERLSTYFTETDDGHWRILPHLQAPVEFRQLNLQSDSFGYERYDVIFCRNVLIYFNAELKGRILERIYSVLAPEGLLFLGASESVSGAEALFEVVNCRPGIAFRKR